MPVLITNNFSSEMGETSEPVRQLAQFVPFGMIGVNCASRRFECPEMLKEDAPLRFQEIAPEVLIYELNELTDSGPSHFWPSNFHIGCHKLPPH